MIGSTIGYYKIEEKLGEGGMGVVYKATDTQLHRTVALKFLPEGVQKVADAKARFLQEARAAATLNHPNICTIHGIDEANGKHFIVMEFVDGQMLSEKMSSSSVRQAIEMGIQIAEGLAAAHEKGIVHRDMKPENVIVRKDGIVQIMDFGLAKLRGASRLTKEGSTVGTAGYMSPEQVQGQDTDHRSDIFSLGVILYEMLTGQRPFKGMHETAIAYEIVNVDSPPMSALKPEITPELDAIVLDCLEKDPKERTQSASQVALELKRYRRESSRSRASRITAARPVSSTSSIAPPRGAESGIVQDQSSPTGRRVPWLLIGSVVGSLAIGFLAARVFLGPAEKNDILLKVPYAATRGSRIATEYGGQSVISPDGTMLAFGGTDSSGQYALYVQPLRERTATRLEGTAEALYPFWSPDNKSLGYFAQGKLMRVDVAGNPPLVLADAQSGRGGAWSPEGVIIFAADVNDRNFSIVPAGGGTPQMITTLDTSSERVPRFPHVLPDGEHYLFVTMDLGGGGSAFRDDYQAFVGSIDGGQQEIPLRGTTNMYFASGHLVFLRQGTLIAQRFNPDTYELSGDPIPLDKNINFWPERAKGDFSVSSTGVLVYAYGRMAEKGEIAWMSHNRVQQGITSATVIYWAQLSPDQSMIAYDELSDADRNADVWLYDVQRRVKTRFTFDPRAEIIPIWSRDSKMIYYALNEQGNHWSIYARRTDRPDNSVKIVSHPTKSLYPIETSPDMKHLLVLSNGGGTGFDIGYVEIASPDEYHPLLESTFNETWADFSPDGRWYVYSSNETGRPELYVRPFLRDGSKFQVTSGGTAGEFIWSRSGEIFNRTNTSIESISVDLSGPLPRFSSAQTLFDAGPETGFTKLLDVTPDGKRLLVNRSSPNTSADEVMLVMNWQKMVESK